MKVHYLFSIIVLIFWFSADAQENVIPVGGDISGGGGQISYTVGQVFYHTLADNSGTVSQGVQHPHEMIIVGVSAGFLSNLSISAYPNPTTDNVILKIETDPVHGCSFIHYQIFDMNGKLITGNNISDPETLIRLDGLLPASYILRIMKSSIHISTFKIILY